jgi:hypothetical protein
VFSCLFLTILTPQVFKSSAATTSAVIPQSVPTTPPPGYMLSGGLLAMMNRVNNGTAILNSTSIKALLNSPLPTGSSYQDSPSIFTNSLRVTGDYNLFPTEDEPSIAVTNQSGNVLMVIGANSISTELMPAYYSKDQGTTWIGPTFLKLSRPTDSFGSDPGLAVNRTGTFFYSFLSIGYSYFNGTNTGEDDVVVATSQDGGNWTNHIAVPRRVLPSNSTITGELYDKDYIAVGPLKSNPSVDDVYVTYTDFVDYRGTVQCGPGIICYSYGENATIMEVHSIDGGLTWSKPVAVSPTVTDSNYPNPLVQGSMPAVALNGDLYVAYYDSGKLGYLNANATIMITKSTNGGVSFSPPVQAGLIPQQLTYCSNGTFYCSSGSFRWASSMFPSMDIARDNRTIYISYGARQSKSSLDPADIFLVTSTDAGSTWSAPVRVNDATSQNGAFFSWLKVSSDGVVHIIWGDRRLDPAGIGYDVFYAEATNNGQTIGPNIRVTDTSTNPLYTYPFVGDYFNLAVSGNQVYPVWTDGRRALRPLGTSILQGETDIFMARLGPRDTPTLSLGPGPAAGYLPTPVTVSGSGLPREAYFAMKMSGARLNSQTYGVDIFFSDKSGNLSDQVLPVSDYYGAYPVELDEPISGLKVASTNLYVVDTRSLQVQITGPTTAHPGDNVTWNILLVPPTGSLSPGGLNTTLSIKQALLAAPDGSSQDLTLDVTRIVPTSYSISTSIPTNAKQGSYTLFVNASQTGQIVQANGLGTTTLLVSPRTTTMSLNCSPAQVAAGQSTICSATVTDTTPGSPSIPTGTVSWSTASSGSFSATTCNLSGAGSSSSCSVSYTSTSAGSEEINASYSGSTIQPSLVQSAVLAITERTISLTVNCTPSQIQTRQETTCTATVTDTTPAGATNPTGNIAWASSGSGSFSSNTCSLSGTGASESCWVTYSPSSSGSQVITGTYSGDSTHLGNTQLVILVASTSASGLQISSLMLGALTGGVGLAGVAAGATGMILSKRRRKQ